MNTFFTCQYDFSPLAILTIESVFADAESFYLVEYASRAGDRPKQGECHAVRFLFSSMCSSSVSLYIQ